MELVEVDRASAPQSWHATPGLAPLGAKAKMKMFTSFPTFEIEGPPSGCREVSVSTDSTPYRQVPVTKVCRPGRSHGSHVVPLLPPCFSSCGTSCGTRWLLVP